MVNLKFSLLVSLILIASNLFSQKVEIPLWDIVPNAIESSDYKEQYRLYDNGDLKGISKVSIPNLSVFLANEKISNGTAVIICPGGGYSYLSIDKEGYKVVKWLNGLGVSAFVLKYRLPNDEIMIDKAIGPLQDAQQAIRIVRENAENWKLDPTKIGIMGFSAGGHLASTLSTHYAEDVSSSKKDISARPDFSILIYPVISMEEGITHNGSRENLLGGNTNQKSIERYSNEKQVNENTPKTFLIHASDDYAVPVENTLNYYKALIENKIPAEMHIYENGGHGFGLGVKGTSAGWPKTCELWLRSQKLIPEKEVLVFSYFKGNGEGGLHLAYSMDGYEWKTLKNDSSFLVPKVGKDKLMRDPCIIKGGAGIYHMVWTVSWTDKGIGYASSKDLINWSEQKFLPVMEHEKNARNTWAPEITYDRAEDIYMIYWATTIEGGFPETNSVEEKGYNHRMYYTTTKDFKSFTPTQLLYEPGFNVIDATIVKDESGFVMFLKDETRNPVQKNIKIAYSKKLTGPYSKASNSISGNYWAEGPTAIKRGGNWVVYFDKYTQKKYGAVKETKNGWQDISDQIIFPEGARHGSVLKVPETVFSTLKKQ